MFLCNLLAGFAAPLWPVRCHAYACTYDRWLLSLIVLSLAPALYEVSNSTPKYYPSRFPSGHQHRAHYRKEARSFAGHREYMSSSNLHIQYGGRSVRTPSICGTHHCRLMLETIHRLESGRKDSGLPGRSARNGTFRVSAPVDLARQGARTRQISRFRSRMNGSL